MNVNLNTLRSRRTTLIAGLIALAGAALLAFGLVNSSENGAVARDSNSPVKAVSANLTEHFSVLARKTGSSDALIGAGEKQLRAASEVFGAEEPSAAGVNVAEARRVSPDIRSRMWVAPASGDSICLVSSSIIARGQSVPFAACHSLEEALDGRTVLVNGAAPLVEVRGLMPDGVESVRVNMVDGSSADAPVKDNAYDIVVTKATQSITFSAGGEETTLAAPSIDGPAVEG